MNVQLRRLSELLPLPATENDADCWSSAVLDIHALLFSFTVELPNLLGILIGLPPKPRDSRDPAHSAGTGLRDHNCRVFLALPVR